MEPVKTLIVEDDFRVADIHEKFLEKIPEVKVIGKALNAEQALELLQENSVDLILLDIYMPDQLGTDLLSTIRHQFPDVDIVMITAATDKAFLEKAMHHGVQNYLIKPVTMERFINIINEYIEKKELIQSRDEIDQEFVDRLFGKSYKDKQINDTKFPKGIDELTLSKVLDVLSSSDEGLSAEQVGKRMGASRTTARRYLEYLISANYCRAEVEYGIVGRPERKYYKNLI
ncbi:response regulator [Scopulibacillus cellulosilyticus]|uniref:Transcriptional regulatory protein n=1 Tax=Scopulibacillus cellulosilyticus TaxID=2665665 RepID=A0ABW2PYT7_9BACL